MAINPSISRAWILHGVSLLLISIVLLLFFVLKNEGRIFHAATPFTVNLVLGVSCLGLLVRGRDLPAPFRILFIYVIGSLVFYLMASYRVHDLTIGHLAAVTRLAAGDRGSME